MKRLLRDRKSGLYYKSAGKWTADKRHARDFKDNQSAIECGAKLEIDAMELVLRFTGYGPDIAFSLKQQRSVTARANSY